MVPEGAQHSDGLEVDPSSLLVGAHVVLLVRTLCVVYMLCIYVCGVCALYCSNNL